MFLALSSTFVTSQTKELFFMKAISLLERNNIASHTEARQIVREGEVEVKAGISHPQVQLSFKSERAGRIIAIEGSFLNGKPLSHTFRLFLTDKSEDDRLLA